MNMDLLQHCLVLYSVLVLSVDSLMFHLEPNARKCLKEEIHKGVLVTGEYDVNEVPGQQVSAVMIRNGQRHA